MATFGNKAVLIFCLGYLHMSINFDYPIWKQVISLPCPLTIYLVFGSFLDTEKSCPYQLNEGGNG